MHHSARKDVRMPLHTSPQVRFNRTVCAIALFAIPLGVGSYGVRTYGSYRHGNRRVQGGNISFGLRCTYQYSYRGWR
ncbi:MAG: hypothetical protein RL392_1095 [Pseudomonadota bacterium]|jgi:hypothetical protein